MKVPCEVEDEHDAPCGKPASQRLESELHGFAACADCLLDYRVELDRGEYWLCSVDDKFEGVRTAVIVTDRGEMLRYNTGPYWRHAEFAVPRKVTVQPGQLRPFGVNDGDSYWLNEPFVFDSVQIALRAMQRLRGRVSSRKLAVVS